MTKLCVRAVNSTTWILLFRDLCPGRRYGINKLTRTLAAQDRLYWTFRDHLCVILCRDIAARRSIPPVQSAALFKQSTRTKAILSSSSAEPATETINGQAKDGLHPLPFEAIPGPKGIKQWPLIGALMLFKPFTSFTTSTSHLLMDSLFETYGPIVRCQLRGPTVLVREINDVETILRNEGVYPRRSALELPLQFAKRNNYKKGFNEVQGEAWHLLRAALNKHIARVNSATYYMPEQNKVALDFRNILETGTNLTPEELSDIFFRFSAESIGVVCFNRRIGFLDPDYANNPNTLEYLRASKAHFVLLQDEIRGRSIMHRVYRNRTYKEYEKVQMILKRNSIQELKRAVSDNDKKQRDGSFNPDEPNLLNSLLSEPTLDFDDIQNLMSALYNAGTDSTGKNLQVFFYNLATHPDKQETLYNEILDVLGPDDPLTPEALGKMSYLKAALKESFRLNIPALGLSRILPTDVVLSGYRVPAGVQVFICGPNVSKAYFENPDQYIPERWLRSKEGRRRETNIHPMSLLPFGHGPRNCIGRRFAEQEIYLATVKVLQKLRIGVKEESENTRFTYSIFVGPDKPIAFTFTRR